jgi:flavin-dependent dehydrogenase
MEPRLKHASIFTHYEGARRDPGLDGGATLVLKSERPEAWFWFIPLPDDRASIGVVAPVESLIHDRSSNPEEVFAEELERCPAVAERLASARRVRPVEVARDFSYSTSRQAGDGWVLIGDAGGFIDPIYSTGVNLALKSGELAADTIHAALAEGDLSGERLSLFTPVFRQGVESLRVLVYAFYHPQFSFSRFLRQYPECRGELIDMLIGNVFDKPIDRVLAALTATMESLEPSPTTIEP